MHQTFLDLSFTQSIDNLTKIESDLVDVAQTDGDFLLEVSDFVGNSWFVEESDKHQKIVTNVMGPIEGARSIFINRIIARQVHDPKLAFKMSLCLSTHDVSLSLAQMHELMNGFGQVYQELTEQGVKPTKIFKVFNFYLEIYGAMQLNDWLLCDRDLQISETFSEDMQTVLADMMQVLPELRLPQNQWIDRIQASDLVFQAVKQVHKRHTDKTLSENDLNYRAFHAQALYLEARRIYLQEEEEVVALGDLLSTDICSSEQIEFLEFYGREMMTTTDPEHVTVLEDALRGMIEEMSG